MVIAMVLTKAIMKKDAKEVLRSNAKQVQAALYSEIYWKITTNLLHLTTIA